MWRDNKEHLATEHTVYLNTDKVYDYANVLQVRLHALINSDASIYFD